MVVDTEIDANAERIARQRLCVAEFMDCNAANFASPKSFDSWVDFAQTGKKASGQDRHVVDKAVGMLVDVMRSAQRSFSQESIGEVYARARDAGLPDFEPDAKALVLGAEDGNEADQVAYAQTVTIYKLLVEEGMLNRDDLARNLAKAFDELPGKTQLMRSLIDTARRIALLDAEYVFEQT